MECGLSVGLCVCLSVHELCKIGWLIRDADWRVDSGGPKEPWITWWSRSPRGEGAISLHCLGMRIGPLWGLSAEVWSRLYFCPQ